jgi:hypothetical protein
MVSVNFKYAKIGVEGLNDRLATILKDIVPGGRMSAESHKFLFSSESPLWFRDYATHPETNCRLLEEVLMVLQADRMVIAHTFRFKRITQHCNGKLFLIDIKMSRYMSRTETDASALELTFKKGKVKAKEINWVNCDHPVLTIQDLTNDEIYCSSHNNQLLLERKDQEQPRNSDKKCAIL